MNWKGIEGKVGKKRGKMTITGDNFVTSFSLNLISTRHLTYNVGLLNMIAIPDVCHSGIRVFR